MREETLVEQQRLYQRVRFVIHRHYSRPLTVAAVARALVTSPRQIHRAYELCSETTFREDLFARRMVVAAELLAQRSIPIGDVARLVGYRQPSHFAKAFRRASGRSPASFRQRLHSQQAGAPVMLPANGASAADRQGGSHAER